MKVLRLIVLLNLVACDPYGFGFKKNPAYVLDEAMKAISNLDDKSFLEVTGKEALCIYGNEIGISYLKSRITFDPGNIKLVPTLLNSLHFTAPAYVGYWSYYHERYQVDITDKRSSEKVFKVIVDCEYGTDSVKNERLINLKKTKYKKKECRLVKVIPQSFPALPLAERCKKLEVSL